MVLIFIYLQSSREEKLLWKAKTIMLLYMWGQYKRAMHVFVIWSETSDFWELCRHEFIHALWHILILSDVYDEVPLKNMTNFYDYYLPGDFREITPFLFSNPLTLPHLPKLSSQTTSLQCLGRETESSVILIMSSKKVLESSVFWYT